MSTEVSASDKYLIAGTSCIADIVWMLVQSSRSKLAFIDQVIMITARFKKICSDSYPLLKKYRKLISQKINQFQIHQYSQPKIVIMVLLSPNLVSIVSGRNKVTLSPKLATASRNMKTNWT